MTIRELLDELGRIAEMQSMADSLDSSTQPGKARCGHLLGVSIERAKARIQARFSPGQIEAAMRMRQMLADEAA